MIWAAIALIGLLSGGSLILSAWKVGVLIKHVDACLSVNTVNLDLRFALIDKSIMVLSSNTEEVSRRLIENTSQLALVLSAILEGRTKVVIEREVVVSPKEGM